MQTRLLLLVVILVILISHGLVATGCGKARFEGGGAGQLTTDLNRLDELNFSETASVAPTHAEFSTDVTSMRAWIQERIHFIIPQTKVDNLKSVANHFRASGLGDKKDIKTMASNVGAELYLEGRYDGRTYEMSLGGQSIRINTPRVGILMVGPGLNDPSLLPKPRDPGAMANSIFRLKTLFHEGRHSDARGEHAGFLHKECPPGHDYAGSYSCDKNQNGPYTVGIEALRVMALACKNADNDPCSATDLQYLNAIIADNASRVMDDRVVDPTPVAPFEPAFQEILKEFSQADLKQ